MKNDEAISRLKSGNFSNGYGFDLQTLINAVGGLGEMLRNGYTIVPPPHVMTIEELCLWDGSFMLETIVGNIGWASYFGEYDQCGDIICRMVDIDGGVNDRYKSMYGSKWRCWTSRPDEKVRTETPWEAQ